MQERLQKVLAAAGLASRRGAEEIIRAGRVTVNGHPAVLGQAVDSGRDVVLVDGRPLTREQAVYLALNKPPGYVTSRRSTHGELTVLDLVHVPERVFPVGRLDKDTAGLLLLTNDGAWANLISHPRYQIEKEYVALVRGVPSLATITQLEQGIELRDGTVTAPAEVKVRRRVEGNTLLDITLVEGKKRQIRLMAAVMGHPALRLERVRVGPVELGSLAPGNMRPLTTQEVTRVRAMAARAAATPGA